MEKLSNNRNGRQKLVVGIVEVSLLHVLPKVAIAGECLTFSIVNYIGSFLRHGYTHCTLRPLPSYTVIQLQNRAPFPPFAICHPEVNDIILK